MGKGLAQVCPTGDHGEVTIGELECAVLELAIRLKNLVWEDAGIDIGTGRWDPDCRPIQQNAGASQGRIVSQVWREQVVQPNELCPFSDVTELT